MHINLIKTYVKPVTFPLLRVYTQNIYNCDQNVNLDYFEKSKKRNTVKLFSFWIRRHYKAICVIRSVIMLQAVKWGVFTSPIQKWWALCSVVPRTKPSSPTSPSPPPNRHCHPSYLNNITFTLTNKLFSCYFYAVLIVLLKLGNSSTNII